jgi:hypothetical protein
MPRRALGNYVTEVMDRVIVDALAEASGGCLTNEELFCLIEPHWNRERDLDRFPLSTDRMGKCLRRIGFAAWRMRGARGWKVPDPTPPAPAPR